MRPVSAVEFPAREAAAFRKARRLEWLSIAYLASSVVFLYLVMGSSQAMRTSWLEDVISLVPPIAFLIASRIATKRPSKRYPYGMHGAVSIGYLSAALALLAMGGFLFFEAASKLVMLERTSIGGFDLFGTTIWAGWPMLAALAYTGIPSFFLGRAKLKLASTLHDKVLYADAEMNRADWMAEVAAAVGVIGTGFGLWWMDGAAAAVVSLDIVRDGLRNVKTASADLIEEMPRSTTHQERPDPLPAQLARYIESFDWVEKAEVRMREDGHVFLGEAFVVPKSQRDLIANVEDLAAKARAFNWRIQEIVVMPVSAEFVDAPPDEENGK